MGPRGSVIGGGGRRAAALASVVVALAALVVGGATPAAAAVTQGFVFQPTPRTVAPGGTLTVHGQCAPPSSGSAPTDVKVILARFAGGFADEANPLATVSFSTTPSASWTRTIDVPAGIPAGTYAIGGDCLIHYSVDGFSQDLFVAAIGEAVTVTPGAGPPAADGAVVTDDPTPTAGQTVNLSGAGFAPQALLGVFLYSTPIHLADGVATGGGGFALPVTVPDVTAAGTHTLVVSGLAADGTSVRTLTVSLDVAAAPEPPGGGFHPVTPFRLLDSRLPESSPTGGVSGWSGSPLSPGEARDLPVAGVGAVPAGAAAVVMNVTVTGGSASSYLAVAPAGAPPPETANLLFAAGQTVPNAVTARLGMDGKVSVFNQLGTTHVIVDVVGWYDADGTGDRFVGLTPDRLYDSRSAGPGGTPQPLGAGEARAVPVQGVAGVPAEATAVVLNLTATQGSAASFVQAYPAGAPQPVTANLLFAANQTTANLVVVGVGAGGAVQLFNQLGSVHLVADVVGYYQPGAGGVFHPINPARLLDSRSAAGPWGDRPLGAGESRPLTVTGGAIPGGATGLVANLTVTGGTAASFLSVSPSPGPVPPPTANLLFAAGQTTPNLVVVSVPGSGSIDVYNQLGTADVIVDAAGYFAAPPPA